VIPFLVDDAVAARPGRPSRPTRPTRPGRATPQQPETNLVRTYLQNAGSTGFGLRSTAREQADADRAQDLWDYLGDFA
jgi:hypothetical protein